MTVGTYTGNQSSELANPSQTATASYIWTSSIRDWSFDDFHSEVTVNVEGNQNGYIWGSYEAILGKLGSATLIIGKFSCIP